MEQGKLKRSLSLLDLTFLGLGAIIGSGWLLASQGGAQTAGPAAWISWVIGAVAVGMIGLVYAELGGALPRTGGIIRYPDYTHGPIVGYLMGFAALVAYSTVPGIEAEAVRAYAQSWWTALGTSSGGPTVLGWSVQFVLILFFFLVNYWSVNVFGKFNTFITFIKFIVPTLTVIVLLTQFKIGNFSSAGFAPFGFTGIEKAVSISGIVFSFLGFRQAVDFAGEAKNPQRTVPLSIIFSLAIAAVLYVLLQVTFVGAVPGAQLAHGWANVSFKAPFADLAGALGFGWLATLLFADAAISPSGTANIYLSSTARVIFAWARNKTFFPVFARVNKATGVPRPALWLAFILSIFWTLPFPTWQTMVGVVSSATVMTYIVGPISAAALRRTAPNLKRPFFLPGMSVIAPIAFVIASLIIYWTGWSIDWILLVLELVVFALYFVFRLAFPESPVSLSQQLKSAVWMVVYFAVMLLMSYLGDASFGGQGIIAGPWDQIIVIVISFIAYYWGLASALPNPDLSADEPEETIDHVHEVSL